MLSRRRYLLSGFGDLPVGRLSSVPLRVFMDRHRICFTLHRDDRPKAFGGYLPPDKRWYDQRGGFWTNPQSMTSDQALSAFKSIADKWGHSHFRTLWDIWKAPTSEEISVARHIDSFVLPPLGVMFQIPIKKVPQDFVCWGPSTSRPLRAAQEVKAAQDELMELLGLPVKDSTKTVRPPLPSPFLSDRLMCTYPERSSMIDPFRGVLTNLPYSTNNPREMWYFENQDPRRAIFWGIKGTESVGLINFENIQKMVRVVSAYPWPNPGPLFSLEWTKKILDRLRKIAHEPTDVSEEDIRTWVTLTLMEKFDAIVRDVNDYMEDQAKADKRRALIRAIAMIALSAAMVVTLPVALSATFGVALTAVKTVDRVKAARALAEASKEFEKTDFEFSQELERVAMLLDEDAARAVLTGGPTLIEKADQIIAPSPPPPPPPTPTESVTPTAKVAVGPNRLTAKVLRKSVGLTWNPGKYVSGYVVKRSYEGKGYKEIGKVVANVTTYADSNVEYDRTYFYTVQGVQSSETAHGGELTGSTNTVKISIPKPKPDYEVVIDGRSAGFAETLEKVTALALEVSVPGDRVQILYRGEPVGLFIRTAGGMVRVPPGKEEAVLSASKDDILRLIDAAQRKAAEEVEKKKEGGFPWGLLLIPVGIAGAVAASK